MIYLKMAHIEDNDADYFAFGTLEKAIEYMNDEQIIDGDWQLSSVMFEEIPEGDYTLIEVVKHN